jgi:hypothetical protein
MIGFDKTLTIVKEIRDYIIPLGEEELFQLESSLLREGCRDPLIVWQKSDSLVLVDGHNRYKICQKHNLPFKVRRMNFEDINEVKVWMVDNQMGRRNLTADQMSYYRGVKYLSLKKQKGGYDNVLSKGHIETSTSELLAAKFSVSESTVKRDAKFAEGLEIIGKSNPRLKNKILTGEVKVKKRDVQTLPNAKHPEKLTFKNEADLFNKAKQIRDEILDEVEIRMQKIETEKVKKAQEDLRALDPPFSTREDRLNRIKGMIISAINRAINKKDMEAIKKLRKLIAQLTDELFD